MRRTTALMTQWLAYVALAALTLELCARTDDALTDGAPFWAPYHYGTLFQPSEFGREGRPHARFGKWSMNSQGLRGPELRPGSERWLTFGASETFGLYESPGKEYPRQMAAMLAKIPETAGIDIGNLALPGMRIGRSAYLVRGIETLKASTVFIYPSPANYIGTTAPLCSQTTKPVPDSHSPIDHIRIASKVERLIKRHTPASLSTALRQLSIRWETRNMAVMNRVPEATITAFKADVACSLKAAQAAGARVILVTHATYFGQSVAEKDRPLLTAWRKAYPELREEGFMDLERRANEALKALASESAVTLADAANTIPPGPSYFADFVHFTDDGAQRMAELLIKAARSPVPHPQAIAN